MRGGKNGIAAPSAQCRSKSSDYQAASTPKLYFSARLSIARRAVDNLVAGGTQLNHSNSLATACALAVKLNGVS